MSEINWSGAVFVACIFIAGYCFGGRIGLGIAATFLALVVFVGASLDG